MSISATIILTILGVALVYRAAAGAAGRAEALLACLTLTLGQIILFPFTIGEAAVFAVSALAVERGQALHATRPRLSMIVAAAGGLLAIALQPAWPAWPTIVAALFGSQHGVLATSAVAWLGFAGIVAQARPRAVRLTGWWIAPLAIATLAWASGQAIDAPWKSAAGQFTALWPLVGVGLALLAADLKRAATRRPAVAAAALAVPFVIWNVSLIAVAHRGEFGIGDPVSFGVVGAAQARTLHAWIGHPLSLPASLVFAARNRVGLWRFDVLGAPAADAHHLAVIDIGGADQPFLSDGWHAAERDGDASFRWARARATILVPRLASSHVRIRLRIRAFVLPHAPDQTVQLLVNSTPIGSSTLRSDWEWVEFDEDVPAFLSSTTRLTLAFGQSGRPSEAGGSRDDRDLAGAVDVIEINRR